MRNIVLLLFFIFIILFLIYINYNNNNFYRVLNSSNHKININLPISKYKIFPYNSSISKEGDYYYIYTRIDNNPNCANSIWRKIKEFLNKENTEIFLGITKLDKDLKHKDFNIIKFKNSYEDLRVFFYKNKKYFIGTKFDENGIYPILLDQNYKKIDIVDINNKPFYKNKNFIPIIIDSDIYIIKNHNPLEILKVLYKTPEKWILSNHYKGYYDRRIPNIRGNTLYLPYYNDNNKLISITHDVENKLNLGTKFNHILGLKIYRHYFTILNIQDINNPYIEKISSPICILGNCGIEFVMGFIESFDKNNYIITLGKEDKESYISIISKDKVNDYF
jgi:hypothetical protein